MVLGLKYLSFFLIFLYNVVHDNSKKFSLIKHSDLLFIPSMTEYLPLVSIEAMAFNKKIVSLYKIPSLIKYDNYKFLKD